MAEISAIESTLSNMQANMSEMLGKEFIVFAYQSYFECLVGDQKLLIASFLSPKRLSNSKNCEKIDAKHRFSHSILFLC